MAMFYGLQLISQRMNEHMNVVLRPANSYGHFGRNCMNKVTRSIWKMENNLIGKRKIMKRYNSEKVCPSKTQFTTSGSQVTQ